jgi:hypothetical protein
MPRVQGARGEGAPISPEGEAVAGVRCEVGGRRSTGSAGTTTCATRQRAEECSGEGRPRKRQA